MWIDIKKTQLPRSGKVIVSVTRLWGEPAAFTDAVRVEDGISEGADGDTYIYHNDITHWQWLPEPAVPVIKIEIPFVPDEPRGNLKID